MPTINPYKEALKEPANLMGIAGLVAVCAATLNPIPLLAGIVMEAGYLLFLPETEWYKTRLQNRGQTPSDLATKSKQDQILPTLREDLRNRYVSLEQTRSQIEAKVRTQVSFRPEIFDKLDRLLNQFLDFAVSEQEFRAYLSDLLQQFGIAPAVPRGYVPTHAQVAMQRASNMQQSQPYAYQPPIVQGQDGTKWVGWAVNQIQTRFNSDLNSLNPEAETDPALKELKAKRADVISRRSDHVARLGKAIVNLDLQLQLIEDTFGLINDEVRSRNPDQVVGEIDNLMLQTDSLSKTLQELGTVETVGARV